MSKIKRRTFVTGVGAAAGAAALAGDSLLGGNEAHAASSKVYSAYSDKMVTGTTESTVQEAWVQAGVDACVKAMTGQSDVGKAWEAIFSGVTLSKKIAIKINCLNTSVHPQLATVKALVVGMTKMLGGKYPASNISLFDNNLWTKGKVQSCYGASNLDALGIAHGEDNYNGAAVTIGGTKMYMSKYLSDAAYGVSLAKMSPHQYYAGGLSGVIKNMMGAVSTSTSTYKAKKTGKGFHDGSPYTAFCDLFKGYCKAHLQLHIVDMLFACRHENEKGWSKVVNRITMGADPCAVDAYNVDAINALKMNVNKAVTKAVPSALASCGIGNASYTLVEPAVTLGGGTPATSRDDLDAELRDRRSGKAADSDVRALLKKYRGGK